MKKLKLLFFILMGIIVIHSCRQNDTIDLPNETPVNDTETVTASVTGIVVNENNIPVQGASVSIGSNTTTTDIYGMFTIRNKSISKNNTHIKVTKTGYFNGNRSLLATANRNHNVRIKLLPKTNTGTITASAGGVVTLGTGGKVTFPVNAISDASGNAYTGTVNVAMAWINPLANDLGSIIQGDLRGITTAGGERALETYGMLGVELTGTSGQSLKIATGKTAEISMPIPSALQASAPASIPLWHFDEVSGRWKEEGSANKVGTNYVGNVTHFSFWNCDVPANFVNLCINVVNASGQALSNVQIRIRKANSPAISATGTTDSLGNVCGAVFKNEPLVLEVLDRCGNVVYTQNIGPYAANASVNIVATIPTANVLTLTGNVVNCSNTAVANGSVLIYTGGGYYYNVPLVGGSFTAPILNCSGNTINYSVLAIDNATQQQGNPTTGSGTSGTVAIGQLSACGTSAVQFINTIIDGVPDSWIYLDSLGGGNPTPIPPYSFAKSIVGRGSNSTPGTQSSISFSFSYNATLGAYPLSSAFVFQGSNTSSQQIVTANPQVTLTEIGTPITGFIAGNYNINMLFQPGNITRNVVCNFRVRR